MHKEVLFFDSKIEKEHIRLQDNDLGKDRYFNFVKKLTFTLLFYINKNNTNATFFVGNKENMAAISLD